MRTIHIKACEGRSIDVKAGQKISVMDVAGGQVADFFAVSAADNEEFLSPGVTIDCNDSLGLKTGDIIYTNCYKPMFEVLHDDVGTHDLIHPCCRPEMYDFFYQNGTNHPNCLDNINKNLNLRMPIIHPVNLFMNTVINPDGSIAVKSPVSKPGDKIVLKALMDARLGIAACSVSESVCNSGRCTGVDVILEG